MADHDTYARGAATLLASWQAYARGSSGASLERLGGITAAIFPAGAERDVYNNALVDRDLPDERLAEAHDAVEAAYRVAGVDRYATWVHESHTPMQAELERRGYRIEETTRAMAMPLSDLTPTEPSPEVVGSDLAEHRAFLERFGAAEGLLTGADPEDFHVVGVVRDGVVIATGLALDHEGDCGIFNVGTIEAVRRQGLGTGVTGRLLADAVARGCTTASLQATQVAEGVYAALGFCDLGRILEYVRTPGT